MNTLRDARYRSQATSRTHTAPPVRPRQASPGAPEPRDTYQPQAALDTELRSFLEQGRSYRATPAWTSPPFPEVDLGQNIADMDEIRRRNAELARRHGLPSLTGAGVTIGFIDQVDESDGRLGSHARRTSELAGGPAPGARQAQFSATQGGRDADDIPPMFPRDMPDDPALLDEYLRKRNGSLDQMNTRLQQLLASRDPSLRVLNISMGPTKRPYYDQLFQRLGQQGDDGRFSNPRLREEILAGLGDHPSEAQVRERIAKYVDKRLDDPQSGFQQSLKDYRETTRQFEENGVSLVVAAANSGSNNPWDKWSPGSGLNLLARSPHVISVGAADRDPQGNLRPAPVSGFGDAGSDGFRPTLTAPGSHTSYSTPFVSGVLATMLEANPNLTPAQLRQLLQQASQPFPQGDPRQQGAGLLDPQVALELALRSRSPQ